MDFLHTLKSKAQTALTMPDKEDEWGALTQQVFRAISVVVVVVGEMVDPVTAALIDAYRRKTSTKSLHINNNNEL